MATKTDEIFPISQAKSREMAAMGTAHYFGFWVGGEMDFVGSPALLKPAILGFRSVLRSGLFCRTLKENPTPLREGWDWMRLFGMGRFFVYTRRKRRASSADSRRKKVGRPWGQDQGLRHA